LPGKKPGKRSARRESDPRGADVTTYRHDPKRKHLLPAGLAAQGKVQAAKRAGFACNPQLPPALRESTRGLLPR